MKPASRNTTSASRYQSISSMYMRGLIPRNSTELTEAVPIGSIPNALICQNLYHASCNKMQLGNRNAANDKCPCQIESLKRRRDR